MTEIYTFHNDTINKTITGTRYECTQAFEEYGISFGSVHNLIEGNRKEFDGWCLLSSRTR